MKQLVSEVPKENIKDLFLQRAETFTHETNGPTPAENSTRRIPRSFRSKINVLLCGLQTFKKSIDSG